MFDKSLDKKRNKEYDIEIHDNDIDDDENYEDEEKLEEE